MAGKTKKKFRFDISVWVAVSAIIVLAVVAATMTLAHFRSQREQAVALFIEKGATLMQTFEAGLHDRPNIGEDNFPLRKLLIETADQPDIDYMILTDAKGTIIADSDPSMLGQPYGLDLDLKSITSDGEIRWRQAANPEGAGTFEVYRSFSPEARIVSESGSAGEKPRQRKNNYVIYVGFNMARIEQASREDTRNTIVIAVILLLVGSLAIVSLFLVQAYRLAHTSLSRITIFSEALVKNMPIGLIALDNQGLIVTCNEKAQAVLDAAGSEAAGIRTALLLPAPLQEMLGRLPERGGLLEQDIRLNSGGTEQTWEAAAAGLVDDGKPAGKILLIRDVTAIRQMEKELSKSRHLSSIGSLAAGVAHEIRNPLSSIKGFAVYFKERLAGNKEDEQTADIMIAEVERLNRVISQLIEFARPLELKKERTDITDLVQHTIKLVAAGAAKNNVTVATDAAAVLPPVVIDNDKIKQVLLNIFLNSLAAMPHGGRLTVGFMTEKKCLNVVISDSGSGIEEADLPRIYDPYFTSKPAGTGLGLAVVQKIMEAHDGTVRIESAAGQGTKVFLSFPLT
jgi:two-component system, NtrC family, sensor histidine kinase HydH